MGARSRGGKADEVIRIDVVGNADKYAASTNKAAKETALFGEVTAKAEKAQQRLQMAQVAAAGVMRSVAGAYDLLISRQVEATSEIQRLAQMSGLSERALAALRMAATQAGVPVEDLVPIDLAERLIDLRAGAQSVTDDFALLGLSAESFVDAGDDMDEVLRILIEGMVRTEDRAKRTAGATALLSTNGERLNAVFGSGAVSMERYIDLSARVGSGTEANVKAGADWGRTLSDARTALDAVSSALTRVFAETGAAGKARDAILGLVQVSNFLTETLKNQHAMLTLDWGAVVGPAEVWRRALESTRAYYDAVQIGAVAEREARESGAMGFRRTEEAAVAAAAKVYDLQSAVRGLWAITDAANASALTQEQALEVAYGARLGSIQDIIDAATRDGATQRQLAEMQIASLDAVAAVEAEYERERLALLHEGALAQQAALDERKRAEVAAFDELMDLREAEAQAERDFFAQRQQQQQAAAQGIADSTAAATQGLAQMLADAGPRFRGAAMAAFVMAKASAMAQAGVNTALAITQGLAAAPPPLSFVLAGAQGAAGAVQIAAIAAQQPRFHVGTRGADLAPDEQQAVITRREVVLTPQGQQAADLNAGIRGGAPVYAVLSLGNQAVDVAAARAMRSPSSELGRAIRRDLPGHTRRRR